MIYGMDDPITLGKIKQKTPRELMAKDKGRIFQLIKKGLQFDEDVLRKAGIRKNISNVKYSNIIRADKGDADIKITKLPKDRLPLEKILEMLNNDKKNTML